MVAIAVKHEAPAPVNHDLEWEPITAESEPQLFWLLVRLEAEYDEAAEEAAIAEIFNQKYASQEGVTCQS